MPLKMRFEKFNKVFPNSEKSFDEWKKMTSWSTASAHLQRLDMSIFPNGLKQLLWENAAVNTVIFTPEQTKIKSLSFNNTHVHTIKLPDELKTVTALSMENTPLSKLKLGGSTGTIEELILPIGMYSPRVTLPTGMVKLKTLQAGTRTGTIILPKDMENLTDITLSVTTPERKVVIPDVCKKLTYIAVEGSYSGLKLPKESGVIEKLIMKNDQAIQIPRVDNVKDLTLTLTGESHPKINVPASLGETLTSLHISGDVEGVKVPPTLVNVTHLYIRSKGEVTVPAKLDKIATLSVDAETVNIRPDLTNIETIHLTAKTAKVDNGKSLDNADTVLLSGVPNLTIKLPEQMMKAKTVTIPAGVDRPEVSSDCVVAWGL